MAGKRNNNILEAEYTPNAAAQARERERERLARWREKADEREAHSRQIAALEARERAKPIEDRAELATHVERLATAFGLKRKRT